MEVDGKLIYGCTADDGVGGGMSKVFAYVFRVVGESVEMLRDAPSLFVGGDGGIAVFRESFGLLGAIDFACGIIDNMAPTTWVRMSDLSGEGSRCRVGTEVV